MDLSWIGLMKTQLEWVTDRDQILILLSWLAPCFISQITLCAPWNPSRNAQIPIYPPVYPPNTKAKRICGKQSSNMDYYTLNLLLLYLKNGDLHVKSRKGRGWREREPKLGGRENGWGEIWFDEYWRETKGLNLLGFGNRVYFDKCWYSYYLRCHYHKSWEAEFPHFWAYYPAGRVKGHLKT